MHDDIFSDLERTGSGHTAYSQLYTSVQLGEQFGVSNEDRQLWQKNPEDTIAKASLMGWITRGEPCTSQTSTTSFKVLNFTPKNGPPPSPERAKKNLG